MSILLFTLFITACAKNMSPNINNVTPNINTQQVNSITEDYYLRAGDAISIKFFVHPELNENATIRPDGKISLQLIDDIKAEGATLADTRACRCL